MNYRVIWIAGIGVIILLIIGLIGIPQWKKEIFGACSQTYTQFLFRPFLQDVFQCRGKNSCKVDEQLKIFNARAAVAQCLCRDQEKNANDIVSLYNTKLVPLSVPERRPVYDVNFICSQGALRVRLK